MIKKIAFLSVMTTAFLAKAQIPADHLEAYYPFDGNATDQSSNSNNGVVNGATLTADRFSNLNSAYFFDGINDWINLGNSNSLHYTDSTNSSISLWFNSNSSTLEDQVLLRYDDRDRDDSDSPDPRNILNLRLENTDLDMDLDLRYSFGSTDPLMSRHVTDFYSDSILVNLWYHLVAIKDNDKDSVYLYLNGKRILAEQDTSKGIWETTGQYMMMGRYQNSPPGEFFSGTLDDVRFYSDVLNECEIWSLYKEGVGVFDLGITQNGNTFTSNEKAAAYQWIDCNDNSLIQGATNQTFTAMANGSYAVILNNGICADTSACITISDIGIIENSFEKALSVYPNPTKGDLTIEFGAVYDLVDLKLTDLSGKLIMYEKVYESNFLHLELEMPAGVYLLTISSGNKKAIIRILKQ